MTRSLIGPVVQGWRSAASATALLIASAAMAQAYFQQQVDHVIDVRLDDRAHVLHATQTFTYHNNSTTTLDTLWIHLWPNAYRDRSTELCRQKDAQNDHDLHFAKPTTAAGSTAWISAARMENSNGHWMHNTLSLPGSSSTNPLPPEVPLPFPPRSG